MSGNPLVLSLVEGFFISLLEVENAEEHQQEDQADRYSQKPQQNGHLVASFLP